VVETVVVVAAVTFDYTDRSVDTAAAIAIDQGIN
jgi:hypothetical protein